jgi:hypothetical protein
MPLPSSLALRVSLSTLGVVLIGTSIGIIFLSTLT